MVTGCRSIRRSRNSAPPDPANRKFQENARQMPASTLAAPQLPAARYFPRVSGAVAEACARPQHERAARMNVLKPKSLPSVDERRRSRRRQITRVAKIQFGSGTLPRDCLITDISDGGVRLHVEGFDVADDFVLLLTGEDVRAKEGLYRVVWRLGYEIGAKFVGHVRRAGIAAIW